MPAESADPARRYLQRVRLLEEDLSCRQVHLRTLTCHAAHTLPARSGSNQPGDPTSATVLRVEALRAQIARRRQQLISAQQEAEALLARMPSARYRSLLEMRYLSGLPWEEISEALEISPRAVMRRHQRALAQLNVLLKEQKQKDLFP